jgi:hypothetical protein
MDERYGFRVVAIDYQYGPEKEPDGKHYVQHAVDPPNWAVYLPHQCDDWNVTDYGAPQGQAVAELERFIAEAQQALAALREGREFGAPNDNA